MVIIYDLDELSCSSILEIHDLVLLDILCVNLSEKVLFKILSVRTLNFIKSVSIAEEEIIFRND